MRFAGAFAATAASCGLYALAFPPFSWQAFAWVALAPFFWALTRVGLGGGLLLAWFWAVFASSFVADALPRSVESYFLQPPWMSLLFALGVWSFTGSLYYMGFAPVHQALTRRSSVWAPLGTGVAWAFFELLRGRLWTDSQVFTGNPWALLAYSQAGFDELVQVASLVGSYGVSFLVAWVNAGLVAVVLGAGIRALALPIAVVVVSVCWGFFVLPSEEAPEDAARLAIVQGNLDLGSQWRSDHYGRNLDVYLRLTVQAAADRPDLVVWPESALTFFLEDEPLYARAIGSALSSIGSQLIVGGPRRESNGTSGDRFFNSVYLMEAGGALAGRYDKRHLVPFAEFLPLRQIDVLRRRFERVRVFEHGEPSPPLATAAGPVGILLCNEAMLPEIAARRVAEGAEILVAPSNDTWIQDHDWAELMFDLVSMRAVEQRRMLVRASTSGPSAIIDPYGRVLARSAAFSQAIVSGPVWGRKERSVYGVVGDLPWAFAAAGVALFLVRRRAD